MTNTDNNNTKNTSNNVSISEETRLHVTGLLQALLDDCSACEDIRNRDHTVDIQDGTALAHKLAHYARSYGLEVQERKHYLVEKDKLEDIAADVRSTIEILMSVATAVEEVTSHTYQKGIKS